MRGWHRHTAEEDKLRYSTKYVYALEEIKSLRTSLEHMSKLFSSSTEVPVKTRGECLPASGYMLWSGGGFALVWFEGSNVPMVWPNADLEVIP